LSDPSDIEGALLTAQRIKGISPSAASGLLSLLYPFDFGTCDRYVVAALLTPNLGQTSAIQAMKPDALTTEDCLLLIELMREKASANNASFGGKAWTPRKIDKVLWAAGHN
jgi:hypothetical protein